MYSGWLRNISRRTIGPWRRSCRTTRGRASHEGGARVREARKAGPAPRKNRRASRGQFERTAYLAAVCAAFRQCSARPGREVAAAREADLAEWIDGVAARKARGAAGERDGDREDRSVGRSGGHGRTGIRDSGPFAEGNEKPDGTKVFRRDRFDRWEFRGGCRGGFFQLWRGVSLEGYGCGVGPGGGCA